MKEIGVAANGPFLWALEFGRGVDSHDSIPMNVYTNWLRADREAAYFNAKHHACDVIRFAQVTPLHGERVKR